MARPPSEVIRDLVAEQKVLAERDEARLREQDRQGGLIEQLSREPAMVQREVAALRQRSDDQTRQHEAWANRAWGFFLVLIGAVLSLASGLIVALARK